MKSVVVVRGAGGKTVLPHLYRQGVVVLVKNGGRRDGWDVAFFFMVVFLLKAVVVCARVQNREHSGNEKSCLPQRQPFSCACALWLCVFYCWPYPKKVQAKCVRVFFDEAWLCAKHKNKRTSATNNEPSPPAPKTQLFCGGERRTRRCVFLPSECWCVCTLVHTLCFFRWWVCDLVLCGSRTAGSCKSMCDLALGFLILF